MTKEELYTELLRRDPEGQQLQCIEECSELIQALTHYRRGKCGAKAVISEIADVTIMCEQMALYFGENDVEKEMLRKIKRQERRLKSKRKE